MMMAILIVVLLVVVAPYIAFWKVMVRRDVVILNEFIATFADVSWHTILEIAMAGWLMIRL